MEEREKIVKELIRLIEKSHAHLTLEDVLEDLPAHLRTVTPEKLPYSIWQLVEHIRIAQLDIVDFSTSAGHEVLDWPQDYWIPEVETISDEAWGESLTAIQTDRERFFIYSEIPIMSCLNHSNGVKGKRCLKKLLLLPTTMHTISQKFWSSGDCSTHGIELFIKVSIRNLPDLTVAFGHNVHLLRVRIIFYSQVHPF